MLLKKPSEHLRTFSLTFGSLRKIVGSFRKSWSWQDGNLTHLVGTYMTVFLLLFHVLSIHVLLLHVKSHNGRIMISCPYFINSCFINPCFINPVNVLHSSSIYVLSFKTIGKLGTGSRIYYFQRTFPSSTVLLSKPGQLRGHVRRLLRSCLSFLRS